jgi:hypothetical protein
MKKWLQSYTTFTRTERLGLAGLSLLLLLLVIIRVTMPLWVHPEPTSAADEQLVTTWEAFKRSQPANGDTTANSSNDYLDTDDENETAMPAVIDLNTADSATLVRLKGIGPVTAGRIVSRRKLKGPFTSIDQLSETGSFAPATLELMKKHLHVDTAKQYH